MSFRLTRVKTRDVERTPVRWHLVELLTGRIQLFMVRIITHTEYNFSCYGGVEERHCCIPWSKSYHRAAKRTPEMVLKYCCTAQLTAVLLLYCSTILVSLE